MTQKVTIVVGLPGSGKTEYIKQLNADVSVEGNQANNAVLTFDDFHACAVDDSPAFQKSRHFQSLRSALAESSDCILSDVAYCNPERLRDVTLGISLLASELHLTISVEFIFFKNEPKQCKENALRRSALESGRDIEREIRLIDRLSSSYCPPEDALPVFRQTQIWP
jgi:predicted kinase